MRHDWALEEEWRRGPGSQWAWRLRSISILLRLGPEEGAYGPTRGENASRPKVGARETRLGQQGSRWAIGMGRKEGEPVREIKGKGIFLL